MNTNDPASLLRTLAARWNAGLAEQTVREITSRFWTAGPDNQTVLADAEQMRRALKEQLARSSTPVEQIRLLEMSYRLEQGLARRDVALSLAKNLRHLAERKTDALHQARAAFLLAGAWYDVSALSFSIDWSKRGFAEAKPIEQRNQGGRPHRLLYADQEVQLALRLGLQGGMHEQAARLLADAIKRFEAIGDSAGPLAALAVQSQIHLLQGRWTDSLDIARQTNATDLPSSSQSAAATIFWTGAHAAARLGDLPDAHAWIDKALPLADRPDDAPTKSACLMTHASILLLSGQPSEALSLADQALQLARLWQHDLLVHWTILERAWIQLFIGRADADQIRATVEAFARFGAAGLEAQARYALFCVLKVAGQDAQTEYDGAMEQFARLKMDWHLAQAGRNAPLLDRSAGSNTDAGGTR